MSEPRTPFAPDAPFGTVAGTDGSIGPNPEDFCVEEVPLYEASGDGEHLYVRFRKRGMTTRDAIAVLARAADVPAAEVGSAGMKDKHAVTTQWISMPARRARPVESWALPPWLAVEATARHGNKLRTGHLRGNRFRIRLTGVADDAEMHAASLQTRIAAEGVPNYFGAQRFGRNGRNLESALAFLAGEAGMGPRRRVSGFERKLYASVAQSEVFNRYVSARLAAGPERPLAGEVVRLSGSGAMFALEDVERELPRFTARDLHPTGPMVGPKTKPALGAARELEAAATAAAGLGDAELGALGRLADGTRRDILVWPEDLTISKGAERERSLLLAFFLPSGSYATELVRAFTRESFFRYTD